MKACILAVGSEMLTPFRVDTNSLSITERLNAIGFDVRLKAVVGDDVDELARVIDEARSRGRMLIVITGGLGPTEDDMTRDAVARCWTCRSTSTSRSSSASAAVRAARHDDARRSTGGRRWCRAAPRLLDNPNGTAPGLWIEHGHDRRIVLLPGPPREMKPMLDGGRARIGWPVRGSAERLFRRVLKITGRTESDVDAQAQPCHGPWATRPFRSPRRSSPSSARFELHLTASAASRAEADAALDAAVRELAGRWGGRLQRRRPRARGRRGDCSVPKALRIEPSQSRAPAGCCVAADRRARQLRLRRARRRLLQQPVEDRAAGRAGRADRRARRRQRAGGARDGRRHARRAGMGVGIGITGIAGPGGGTPEKPVGTVAIAVALDISTGSARSSSSAAARW